MMVMLKLCALMAALVPFLVPADGKKIIFVWIYLIYLLFVFYVLHQYLNCKCKQRWPFVNIKYVLEYHRCHSQPPPSYPSTKSMNTTTHKKNTLQKTTHTHKHLPPKKHNKQIKKQKKQTNNKHTTHNNNNKQ